MTDREKHIAACNFAIIQLINQGSYAVMLDIGTDNQTVVEWKDVLEWLNRLKANEEV